MRLKITMVFQVAPILKKQIKVISSGAMGRQRLWKTLKI